MGEQMVNGPLANYNESSLTPPPDETKNTKTNNDISDNRNPNALRLNEINRQLTELLKERRELSQKLVTPDEAMVGAQWAYTGGETERVARNEAGFIKAQEEQGKAQMRLAERARQAHGWETQSMVELEEQRLARQQKLLDRKKEEIRMDAAKLKDRLNDPQVKAKINEIYQGIMDRHRPNREKLAELDKKIGQLKTEHQQIMSKGAEIFRDNQSRTQQLPQRQLSFKTGQSGTNF